MSVEDFILSSIASLIGAMVGGFFTYKAAVLSMKSNTNLNHKNFIYNFSEASKQTEDFIKISKYIFDILEPIEDKKSEITEADVIDAMDQMEKELLSIFNSFVPDLTFEEIKNAAFENVRAISKSGPYSTYTLMIDYLCKLLNIRNLLTKKTNHIIKSGRLINIKRYYPDLSPEARLKSLEKDFEKLKKELAYK